MRTTGFVLARCANRLLKMAALLACIVVPLNSQAEPGARVLLLQSPAWRERGNERLPLRTGMALESGDRIATGAGSRVLLRLEEGSHVKLGANAQLSLDSLLPPPDAGGLFEGVLDVVKGAFRFTTTLTDRRRHIRARVRSATIGIRGTDVWGKAEDARDFVVLLEGQITIERDGASTTMDVPLSLFMAPRGQAAEPVAPVDPDDLARWAQETEPQAGRGIIDQDGRFRLNLASFRDLAGATELQARLAADGFACDIESVDLTGTPWSRVVIRGYTTRADAEYVAAVFVAAYALASPWVM
jgi:hypothetical protein